MNILAIYYGHFPEIEKLYSRFTSGSSKLKIVVDVDDEFENPRTSFLKTYRIVAKMLPSLAKHSCCDGWESAPLYTTKEEGVSVKRIGEMADFPHLLEHLIVDLQCSLGKMNLCSGITCGWKKPENRFDLFVECDDPRIGIFATCFGVNLINNFVAGRNGEDDYGLILKIAQLVERYPETRTEIIQLAESLSESEENISRAIEQMASFNFFQEPKAVEDEDQV